MLRVESDAKWIKQFNFDLKASSHWSILVLSGQMYRKL